MKLYGTAPSHFTRKVRVVLEELHIPFTFIPVVELLKSDAIYFAENPLLQIPVLEDGDKRLFESDLICEYLLENYAKTSSSVALYPIGNIFTHKQRLAIMNGGMAAGVKLIRAKRSEIPNYMSFPFFNQEQAALKQSLRWLEIDLGNKIFYGPGAHLTLLEITLVSFLEWAVFRKMIPDLKDCPNLARFLAAHQNRPSFVSTQPSKEVL